MGSGSAAIPGQQSVKRVAAPVSSRPSCSTATGPDRETAARSARSARTRTVPSCKCDAARPVPVPGFKMARDGTAGARAARRARAAAAPARRARPARRPRGPALAGRGAARRPGSARARSAAASSQDGQAAGTITAAASLTATPRQLVGRRQDGPGQRIRRGGQLDGQDGRAPPRIRAPSSPGRPAVRRDP